MTYDLRRLRLRGLIERILRTRRYPCELRIGRTDSAQIQAGRPTAGPPAASDKSTSRLEEPR